MDVQSKRSLITPHAVGGAGRTRGPPTATPTSHSNTTQRLGPAASLSTKASVRLGQRCLTNAHRPFPPPDPTGSEGLLVATATSSLRASRAHAHRLRLAFSAHARRLPLVRQADPVSASPAASGWLRPALRHGSAPRVSSAPGRWWRYALCWRVVRRARLLPPLPRPFRGCPASSLRFPAALRGSCAVRPGGALTRAAFPSGLSVAPSVGRIVGSLDCFASAVAWPPTSYCSSHNGCVIQPWLPVIVPVIPACWVLPDIGLFTFACFSGFLLGSYGCSEG